MAHLALAGKDPDLILGQFIGDFVRGPVDDLDYPAGVLRGISAHRRVDAASDRSELYKIAKAAIPAASRRFSGIVMDMYADHLLHLHWEEIMHEEFSSARRYWRDILAHPPHPLPPAAKRFAWAILDHDLLSAYRDLDEIRYALSRIGKRLRKPVSLEHLIDDVLRVNGDLREGFVAFFADMRNVADA